MGLEVYLEGQCICMNKPPRPKRKGKKDGSYVNSLRMRGILHLLKEVAQFALCSLFFPVSRVTSQVDAYKIVRSC
jgi:hypothetical protein